MRSKSSLIFFKCTSLFAIMDCIMVAWSCEALSIAPENDLSQALKALGRGPRI